MRVPLIFIFAVLDGMVNLIMSSSRLFIRPLVLAFLFFGLIGRLPIYAGAPPKKPKPPEDHRILITGVNLPATQITIVFKNTGQKETYIIDDLTHVTIGNNPGNLKDIKVGQQIDAYTERDAQTLDSITVSAAEPPPE